jgi:hypothetical protein
MVTCGASSSVSRGSSSISMQGYSLASPQVV